MNIGVRSLRTVKPVETQIGKLVKMLLSHIDLANKDLIANNPNGAKANLEYALFMANELLADHPDIAASFYRGQAISDEA